MFANSHDHRPFFRKIIFFNFNIAYLCELQTKKLIISCLLEIELRNTLSELLINLTIKFWLSFSHQVPESPLWLLSKNRISDAFSALCWLRGWAETQKAQAVAEEFEALQNYSKRSRSCNECIKRDLNCAHPLPTTVEKLKEFKRKQVLKPLFIVMSMFIIAEFSGMTGMTPFIIQIFKAYDSPIAPDQASAIQSFVNTAANILVLFLIKFTGKRKLYLFVLFLAFLCTGIISIYGFSILPHDYNSFELSQIVSPEDKQLTVIPFICLIVWGFCAGCGVNSMPWQFVSEVFPSKWAIIFFSVFQKWSIFESNLCLFLLKRIEFIFSYDFNKKSIIAICDWIFSELVAQQSVYQPLSIISSTLLAQNRITIWKHHFRCPVLHYSIA